MNKESSELSIRTCVFGFQCQNRWQDMNIVQTTSSSISSGEVRYCDGCQKEVYESLDDAELLENIKLNRCVLINRPNDSESTQLMGTIQLPRPVMK